VALTSACGAGCRSLDPSANIKWFVSHRKPPSHRYGSNMQDSAGDLIGKLVIFRSRKARDAWIDAG
jgi:hypothetical protein